VHKLDTFNDQHRAAQTRVRGLIWDFYADLKAYQLKPRERRAEALRRRFDRIFLRRTGFATLDRLLARLHTNKAELLMVLERPEILSSVSPRPATSSASRCGIISVAGSRWRGTRSFNRSTNTSGHSSAPPDRLPYQHHCWFLSPHDRWRSQHAERARPDFCPSYVAMGGFEPPTKGLRSPCTYPAAREEIVSVSVAPSFEHSAGRIAALEFQRSTTMALSVEGSP